MKKGTKNLKSNNKINIKDIENLMDEFLKTTGKGMPYVKRSISGYWDIFDGEHHLYCGDRLKNKFDAKMKELGKKSNKQ